MAPQTVMQGLPCWHYNHRYPLQQPLVSSSLLPFHHLLYTNRHPALDLLCHQLMKAWVLCSLRCDTSPHCPCGTQAEMDAPHCACYVRCSCLSTLRSTRQTHLDSTRMHLYTSRNDFDALRIHEVELACYNRGVAAPYLGNRLLCFNILHRSFRFNYAGAITVYFGW